MSKRFLSALSLALILCLTVTSAFAAEFRPWNKQDSYQYVIYGVYPQTTIDHTEKVNGKKVNVWADDPLCWLVLDVFPEEGVVWMIAQYVLDAHCVTPGKDRLHCAYVPTFAESDLYDWMNSEMLNTMFTEEEQSTLDDTRGKLFILTNTEMINQYGWPKYIDDKKSGGRMCDCTKYALERGVYHGPFNGSMGATFWCDRLRGAKGNQKMQIVGYDGHQSWAGLTRTNVGVRPAIRVKIDDVTFVSGSGTAADPYVIAPVGSGIVVE